MLEKESRLNADLGRAKRDYTEAMRAMVVSHRGTMEAFVKLRHLLEDYDQDGKSAEDFKQHILRHHRIISQELLVSQKEMVDFFLAKKKSASGTTLPG